ncbi:DNA helicase PcrA [Spirulina subsalsa FACHB-351]|uniref:ATP-dependent DNA helicase n=1 Tax=Spirulina subsalsa FACHB-351 TaxID=234711 RepID=A0ABT3L628_9CYAN|nr:DNA helicase PcrA [Spirulina subsalsa]MCW6036963.1 DNA helicase PcrA [Spirulina subsalsa FACHB-351]
MISTPDFLASLNTSQRSAVEHFCGPLLVVAGAGSGKTRALTYRIFHLINHHKVHPENILAVTFTNKAAREMKERIERLFSQKIAFEKYQKPLDALTSQEQTALRSKVYRTVIKPLWIGTFHSLFSRILRYDINKYQDEQGRTWQRNFSIFDESDTQSLVKNITTKQLNLDDKKFNPKSVRYAISNAKNLGLSPQDYAQENSNYRGRVIADVYEEYQNQLAANNALDFDDLILVPVRLFQQNDTVLGYWHQQFRHILVDEYQDTNRIQYDLVRLLATNGEPKSEQWNWEQRSVFVVGDADQSIYSFRMADYTILLGFQEDFGDNLPDTETQTMVKLEENYRSRENILQAANYLIENNTHRIDKVLRPTRGSGEQIYCYRGSDEQAEARFVVEQIVALTTENPELNWGSFAILYRTNAQSRNFEEVLLQANISYLIVGGQKFYDRKEIKDALAYLRVIANPADTVSLLRIINTPRRGIGRTTIDQLMQAATELNVPLWEILSDETSVNAIASRASKAIHQLAKMIQEYQLASQDQGAAAILDGIMEASGYLDNLRTQGTDEADNRVSNVLELYNAMTQFEEENEDTSLQAFLASASLASDLDNLEEGTGRVSLMTLHSAKGLEFPIVFMVGMEQGLFPNARAIQDPLSLEEERRLCYVGITRAQEQLFLTYTQERRLWGYREPAVPSQFLAELPEELISTNVRKARKTRKTKGSGTPSEEIVWQVGDQAVHQVFGLGQVTHVLGSGKKTNLAIQFDIGRKIINPRVTDLIKMD